MIACIVTAIICAVAFFIMGLVVGSCLRVGAKADEQSEKASGISKSDEPYDES